MSEPMPSRPRGRLLPAAEALSALDWAFSDQRGLGRDEFVAQTLVQRIFPTTSMRRLFWKSGFGRIVEQARGKRTTDKDRRC